MDEEQLRQIIGEEIGKVLSAIRPGPQPLLWPLMALVHKWRTVATRIDMAVENEANPIKAAKSQIYKEAADDLEEWIKAGSLRLDS